MTTQCFRRVSGDSAETLRKLRVSTKFPHQEIKVFYAVNLHRRTVTIYSILLGILQEKNKTEKRNFVSILRLILKSAFLVKKECIRYVSTDVQSVAISHQQFKFLIQCYTLFAKFKKAL